MTTTLRAVGAALTMTVALSAQASGEDLFGMRLSGSFGEGGFDRYVPPITHFVLNETPFITTEIKPIYAYHDVPDEFLTGGGRAHAVAVQGRLAVTERFAIIATTDGYTDLDFDAILPNANGFLDLTAGVKYAVISDPAAGNIVTVGLRYTAPIGNVDTAGIDLTGGSGSGYLNGFVSGAKLWDSGWQAQGSLGVQWGIDDDNWSYFHAHGHLDYELAEGFYPLVEANLLMPIEGGDRLPGLNLTGADIFDIGASDPDPIFTLGVGARYRLLDNVILGAAVEGDVLRANITGTTGTKSSVFGWRVTADAVIHF